MQKQLTFNWSFLKHEIIGGITVAFVALPLALSFGVLSGMGAEAGLYGAIFTGFLASMFGGCKGQISGPTGAMTVVLVDMFHKTGLEGLIAAMIVAGLLQILMGLFKLGKYIQLIPKTTIIGFTNGIGVLIFIKQLTYVQVDPILALLAFGTMLLLPRISRKIPAAIVVLVGGTILSKLFLPTDVVVGHIQVAMPRLAIPDFFALDLVLVAKTALVLALLGAIESLLAALVVDEMLHTKHDSDRELIGQGIGNFVAACFGNLIGTGAIVRSAVNVNAGGKGRLSGMIHALVLLLLVVQFAKPAGEIPLAVLGGILMGTAVGMIEFEESYRLSRVSKEALIVIATTTILTVVLDLTTAVAFGTLLSALILIYNMGTSYVHEYTIDQTQLRNKIQSFTIEGALFFGVSDSVAEAILVKSADSDIILINMRNAPVVDASGVIILGKLQEETAQRGQKLILTGLKENTYEKLLHLDMIDEAEKDINLGNIGEAITYAKNLPPIATRRTGNRFVQFATPSEP